MKANTNRSMALEFGDLVDHYDVGRPRLSREFVRVTAARAGIDRRGTALEVGAGSGQLTDALLANGGQVIALEPSPAMAARLRARHGSTIASGRLTVVEETFESFDQHVLVDHLWSADAWHWLDPSISYAKAADHLRPGGRLVTMWTLAAVVDDMDTADRLNTVFRRHSPDLERDPRRPVDEGLLQEGRTEIESSGRMVVSDHWIQREVISVSVDTYAEWQLSYAQISALSDWAQQWLKRAIVEALGRDSSRTVPVTVHRYVVVSKPR